MFATDLRIDRTAVLACPHNTRETITAPETLVDILVISGPRFERKVRIRNESARHIHDVGLPACDDLFHQNRVSKRANGADFTILNMRFDRSGIFHIDAVFQEHARAHDGKCFVECCMSHRHMDDVRITIYGFGDLDAGLHTVSILTSLASGDTQFDNHARHLLVDAFADLTDDACAVFRAATPLIGAGIEQRIQELAQQPAVAAMDRYHAEAADFRPFRMCDECVDRFSNLFFCHWQDMVPVVNAFDRSVDRVPMTGRLCGECAAVLQFDRWDRTMTADGICIVIEPGDTAMVPWIDEIITKVQTGDRIHIANAHAGGRSAADGLPLVIDGHFRRREFIFIQIG